MLGLNLQVAQMNNESVSTVEMYTLATCVEPLCIALLW